MHIRDMMLLPTRHPELHKSFVEDHFAFHKTQKMFSAIAHDQNHEQNNALVKGDGGAVGLTENPCALARWMIAGPEMARIISEFELAGIGIKKANTNSLHHEQTKSIQMSFMKDVTSLVTAFEDLGSCSISGTI